MKRRSDWLLASSDADVSDLGKSAVINNSAAVSRKRKQGAIAAGSALGAALSTLTASAFGIPTTFLVAGVIALSAGVSWRWLVYSGDPTGDRI